MATVQQKLSQVKVSQSVASTSLRGTNWDYLAPNRLKTELEFIYSSDTVEWHMCSRFSGSQSLNILSLFVCVHVCWFALRAGHSAPYGGCLWNLAEGAAIWPRWSMQASGTFKV